VVEAAVSPYSVSIPTTRRLTLLAALLHEALNEALRVFFQDGVDVIQQVIEGIGVRLNLPGLGVVLVERV
jgi:hypothetical protein